MPDLSQGSGWTIPPGGLGMADAERERTLLQRIIDVITAGLDMGALVQRVAGVITEATATDVCFVHLLDAERQRLTLVGATPPFDRHVGTIELAVGDGVAGWVAKHGRPVLIAEDKRADPRYRYIPELRGDDYTSLVSVPMISGPERLVGVLNVHSTMRRDFSESELQLLRTIANLMAGAIDNASLHRSLARRERARERFAERLLAVQESERRRLAGDIHDGISQRLVGLSFHLSAAADALTGGGPVDPVFAGQQVLAARALAAAALDETRVAIAGLRPTVLDDLGLAAGLESLARTLPGVDVELAIDEQVELADHQEIAVYRIAQEALQNIMKHAEADHVWLTLSATGSAVELEVRDDGRGFRSDGADGAGERASYGLSGMRERADLIDADLQIRSAEGKGTIVLVTIPG